MLVEHEAGGSYKVDPAKAPVARSRPVEKMSTREIHRAGLITQGEAKRQASTHGGILGSEGKVKLSSRGLSERGSYDFKQTKPSPLYFNEYGARYRTSDIRRTVTVTGSGESASADNLKPVEQFKK